MNSNKNPDNIILWNATSVKSRISEFYKYLIDHNADIAIIIETWLTPKDTLKLLKYKIYRQDGQLSIDNKPKGEVLIDVYKDVPMEDTPHPATSNIKIFAINVKTTPNLTVGATSPSPPPQSQNKYFRPGPHRTATRTRTLHHRW